MPVEDRRARRSPRAESVPRRLAEPAPPSRARRTRPWLRTSSDRIPTWALGYQPSSSLPDRFRAENAAFAPRPASLAGSVEESANVVRQRFGRQLFELE